MRGLAVAAMLTAVVALAAYLRARDSRAPLALAPPLPAPDRAAHSATRFGVSATRPGDYDLARAGAAWYLSWGHVPAPGVALEFVPMIFNAPDASPVTEAALAALRRRIESEPESYPDGTLWIVGNEIGYRPQRDSRPPARYARDYRACRELLQAVNPSFCVAVGPAVLSRDPRVTRGQSGADDGIDYLAKVLDAYEHGHGEALPAELFSATAHVLEGSGVDVAVFRAQILRLRRLLAERGLAGRGVMVTEFGAAYGRPDAPEIGRFQRETLRFLAGARDPELGKPDDDHRLVQRWAWFTAHPLAVFDKLAHLGLGAFAFDLGQTSLFTREGRLTHLGQAYREAALGRDGS